MKRNIRKVNYNTGKTDLSSKWWAYEEYCDRCGELIQSDECIQMDKPDINEPDYCLECLRHLIDSGILYSEVKLKYPYNGLESYNLKN